MLKIILQSVLRQYIRTKFALLISLKFAYAQMQMCELSVYPKKEECLFIEIVRVYVQIYGII